ncbi:uncharacterized protein LOC122299357 isoform X1 [Carya illinoinensis]|uniref:uncharacterized protein LOC122299357 isoform X1 n=1 Tax=Carya illinoinensis TaxID=32201 RepID=UPI001C71BCE0|nr:uncharacterized protein LOC122299357 isoform X1 [Carya illinoinensis]
MAEEGKADDQLFQLLSGLLQQCKLWFLRKLLLRFCTVESLCIPVKSGAEEIVKSVTCIVQVESLTNQEEVELRSKIEALGLEVTKVPSKAVQPLGELDIAKQLDELSEKLEDVDEKISSAMAADPQVQTLLSGTADVWMPVITATAEERRNFTVPFKDDHSEVNGKASN